MGVLVLISGIIDYKYRKIPNLIIMLILCWALFFSSASIFEMVAGFVVTAVPLFILAIATGKLKGGDYKFLVACATALGINSFVKTLIIAVIIAICWSLIKREVSVPLAFAFMCGYFILRIL